MYCNHCGTEIAPDTVYCPKCGSKVEEKREKSSYSNTTKNSDKKTKSDILELSRIIGIIVTVVSGIFIIPLLWTIPMTIYLNRCVKNNIKTSPVFNFLYLIFVSRIAGILLFVADDM